MNTEPRPLKNPNLPGRRGKLTPEQRKKLLERLAAGEQTSKLAHEYGVSRQAVSQFRDYHLRPDVARRLGMYRSRLLPEERKKIIQILQTSVPADHGVQDVGDERRDTWNVERLIALSRKLFNKKMFQYAARECISEALPDYTKDPDIKPQPPGPLSMDDLSAEYRNDPEFVKFYFSDAHQRIRQKEYEWALRMWEERQACIARGDLDLPGKRKRGRPRKYPIKTPANTALSEIDATPFDGSTPLPHMPFKTGTAAASPGARIGKHAKSKGAPFTKPKRRKKN